MVVRRDADGQVPAVRFECVLIDWPPVAPPDDLDDFRELLRQLCDSGMEAAVVTEGSADAVDEQLRVRPTGPGRLLLCAGPSVLQAGPDGLRPVRPDAGPDAGDAVSWLLADLWDRGIAPEAVLAIGPGGGARPSVPEILADQLRLRTHVPLVARPDPAWNIVLQEHDGHLARVYESVLSHADGRLGTRGSPASPGGAATPAVFMAGVYIGDGPDSQLAQLPVWCTLAQTGGGGLRRHTLNLHAGTFAEEGAITALRFSSLARPGTAVMRATGPADVLPEPGRRSLPEPGRRSLPESGRGSLPGPVCAVLSDTRRSDVLDRVVSYDPDPGAAQRALAEAEQLGFERLLREHREAWARRWRHADVIVEGDRALQQAIRFALFHLMGSVADRGEAAVGARGLSGPAYLGHVFWDSDVFVLPFLAATHPAAARAMLEYRIRRLDAARAIARGLGRRGARFPWESAAEGVDVTPEMVHLPTGEDLRIRTGNLEEHIVADVAWAAGCYLDWTGDPEFAAGPGGELLAETARYWASRVRLDDNGRAHIDDVEGPDEYHLPVDDNAFTNVMARWNLRRAAALGGAPAEEVAQWLAVADALVDGYDPTTRLYEQFAGFFDLEPFVIAKEPPYRRPIAAELLLGVDRTAGAQVVKQADVLMLHLLVPDEVAPGSLEPNLDFYEPRTAHGSSLSPAVHASLLAQAGRIDEALLWLRMAARMDLDDVSASTAGGLHLATMGGLWQALVFGFAGLRAHTDRLSVRPHLPPAWDALELNLRFRGLPLRLRIEPDRTRIESDALELCRVEDGWEVVPR